jgi:hypothetical protein
MTTIYFLICFEPIIKITSILIIGKETEKFPIFIFNAPFLQKISSKVCFQMGD